MNVHNENEHCQIKVCNWALMGEAYRIVDDLFWGAYAGVVTTDMYCWIFCYMDTPAGETETGNHIFEIYITACDKVSDILYRFKYIWKHFV